MSSAPLSASIIGTWELRMREDRTANGELRIDPLLGADPIGLLIYDKGGTFAAQFMKRDRSTAGPAPPAGGVTHPNSTRAKDGYDAYFGTYVVNDATGTVTQTLTAALSKENVGQVVSRHLEVDGDWLNIRIDSATAQGEPIVRTLRWRRLA